MFQKLVLYFMAIIGLLVATPIPVSAQTGTCQNSTQHTPGVTEHQMKVCGDGNLATGYGLSFNTSSDQDIKDDGLGNITTLGIHFDQHGSTVDIGWQGDFQPTEAIRLNRPAYFGPYSEETYSRYRSKNLSYEIEQRTLTEDSPWEGTLGLGKTNNWVVMELLIRNTSSINLTGGRLLYMVDFDPGRNSSGHKGYFDDVTKVGYHTQQPNPGQSYSDRVFGMGIKLLSGTLLGHGMSTSSGYPNNDATFLNQINTPMYAPTQPVANITKEDYISWLVITIPDLAPGQAEKVAVGWCATAQTSEDSTASLIKSCLTTKPYLPAIGVQKITPVVGYVGTNVATYTIASRYTTTGLTANSLQDSGVGNIPITGFGTYPMNYTIFPTMTTPLVTTITVQGSYSGVNKINHIITHTLDIDFKPVITLTVSSNPSNKANVGAVMTYRITATHDISYSDKSSVLSVMVALSKSNSIATFISGDTNSNGRLDNGEVWVYEAQYTPTLDDPNPLVNTITLQGKDLNQVSIPTTTTSHTITLAYNPKLQIVKSGPTVATPNTIGTFNFAISHAFDSDDYSSVSIKSVTDTVAGNAAPMLNKQGYNVGDTNKNERLDKGEEWYYSVGYQFTVSSSNPLYNRGTVTWQDLEGDINTAQSDFHKTDIIEGASAILEVKQSGPSTAKVGDTITYTILIDHADNSGGAAVTIATITNSLPFWGLNPFTPNFEMGDEDQDGKLDAKETFNIKLTFMVTPGTPRTISHTLTVEGRDPENKAIVATSNTIYTQIEYDSGLIITKTGPDGAKVGENVTYTFTVKSDPTKDKVPVSFSRIKDSITGQGFTCPQEGNGIDNFVDEDETWICHSLPPYPILSAAPEHLTNIATVYGIGRGDREITAIAQHTTRIEFMPELVAIASSSWSQARIGDSLTYTVQLRHKAITDQSPLHTLTVQDNLGNVGSCPNTPLIQGQTLNCTVNMTVPLTNQDPFALTITAEGKDGNGDTISTSTVYTTDIFFTPIVEFKLSGPTNARRGDTITYQVTLKHAITSDNSEVCGLQLQNTTFWSTPISLTRPDDNCLGAGETWQIDVPYTIPVNAPVELENLAFVIFTTKDNEPGRTNPSSFTTRLTGPSVKVIIQPNPINLTVGQKVSVTYQVTRLDNDPAIIDSSLVLSSPLFGLATRTSGTPPLLQGQTWLYQVAYTPLTDTIHEQSTTVSAIHQNSIIGRSEVSVTVTHQPELMLTVAKREGQLYTFRIDHTAMSDKSPVSLIELNGQDYICTVVVPSPCTFTATIGINQKLYEAIVEYTTLDSKGIPVSQTLRYDLNPTVYLPLIRKSPNDNPVLALTKTGPATAKAGDTIKYTFTLKHDLVQGQPTATCNITLSDPLIPNLSQTHTGDSNGNTCLNSDETWVYEANYTIPANKTGSIDNTATITGKSAESGKIVSATANWSTAIVNNCVVETFSDPSSGWLVSSGPQVKWEYNNGKYIATSLDPNVLHYATSPKKSVSADYLVHVEANWNTPMGDEYGLVFNVVGSGDTASMYLFNVNTQTGNYTLRRLQNGSYTTLSSGNSASIKLGTTANKLQIQRTGNTFTMFVNDQILGSVNDSSLSASTKVGVDMLPSRSQGGQTVYDTFTICSEGGVQIAAENTSDQPSILGNISRP